MSHPLLKIIAGRYNVKATLQSGGMATVYECRDLHTDQLIAVKRFDRDLHLPEIEKEAFLREVDAASKPFTRAYS